MKRRVIIAVAVTLTAGLSALVWMKKAARPPVVGPLRISCVPGQAHAFAVDYESHGQLLDAMMGLPATDPSATQAVDIVVHGRAIETCIEADASKQVFALELADVTGKAVVKPSIDEAADRLFPGATFVELARDGVVKSIHFAEAMPALGQNIVRDLLSHRSMKLSPRAAGEWRTEEISIDGAYPADYRIESAAKDSVRFTKRRATAQLSPAQTADRPQVHYLDGTLAQIRLDHEWLGDLDSATNVELVSGKKVMARTTTRVALRGGAAEQRSIETLRTQFFAMRASGVPAGDLAASDADRRLDEKIQREELEHETWATLWDKARDAKPDEAKVFLKLRALFKLHPEECKRAAAALGSIESVKDKSFMLVASALASTGTPEAQAALRDAIAGSAGKRDNQEVLIAELGSLDNPDRTTEAYARDLVAQHDDGETRNVAQLALGNMARTLAEAEPERAEALVTEALQQAQSAKTLDARLVSIQTLGNTGSRRSLDALRAAAGDPSFMVRQSVASALRFLTGDDVEQLLLSLVLRDPEQAVRAEAAASMRQRMIAPATFEALAQLVRRDPSETVRQTLISVIAEDAEQFPEAVEVLEAVAKNDFMKDVRNYAAMALAQLRARNS